MPELGLLRDLLLLIGLAIPIVALAHRVNAPPLVGFFVAGFVVGPYGLALIDGPDQIETLSELGVALLLFAVGLELSLSHVRQWARSVFIGGGLQVGATLACIAALALAAGIPPPQALFYGALVAMSSTAIVTKAYADRAELDTPHGRSVLSILVFQDLCVLPLILLLPLLAEAGDAQWTTLTLELGRGLAIMTLLVMGGRLVVKWTLDRVVLFRDRELFTLCIGFFGIGATLVASAAGFSIGDRSVHRGTHHLGIGVRPSGAVGCPPFPRALQWRLLHITRDAARHSNGARPVLHVGGPGKRAVRAQSGLRGRQRTCGRRGPENRADQRPQPGTDR